MSVTPLGNVIQINQNMHIASTKFSSMLSRIDIQDLAAKQIAKDEKKGVEELRAAEEVHKVNEESEREKHQAKDELYRPSKKDSDEVEKEVGEEGVRHIDLKA